MGDLPKIHQLYLPSKQFSQVIRILTAWEIDCIAVPLITTPLFYAHSEI